MNHIDIDDHIIPIDISTGSSHNSLHSQSEKGHSSNNQNSKSSLLIQSVEMPIPSMHTLSTTGPVNRNKRRQRTFLLKLGVSLSAFVIVAVIALQKVPAFGLDEESISKKSFVNTHDRHDDNHNDLPNYAPLQSRNNDKATKIHETSTHKANTKEEVESKSAAEKLVCPQPVTNFVINATDAKDECDGLRKAFDKTCAWNGENPGRRLSLVSETENVSWIQILKQYTQRITPTLSSRRRLEDQTSPENEDDVKSEMTGTSQPGTLKTNENNGMTHISPSLPTGTGHMSDQMAADALGMNSELSDIAKAIEELGNATHSHNPADVHPDESSASQHYNPNNQVEVEDESNKDLTSAAVAVSAIINNPEMIEIQTCCKSILQVFHDECDNVEGEETSDKRLFVIVCVIALCGLIKSLIRHFRIRWLPEAGGCILVGVVGGLFLKLLPNIDFAFSHDMFLRVMVPPIVFEAALNINKRSFRQMLVPIVMLALFGTILSTLLTASIVFYGTYFIQNCTNIPFIESLTFGALISSIDPIAVLSVLSNMGMSDKDQIYVIIFGESLLNDGVAIVLFQTLLNFMDENLVIDSEAVYLATLQFLVIAFGSLFVGLASGLSATLYFWLMQGIQTPLVEVIMFICWAFIPYYVCDGIDWSGIVAIVAVGFFMDIYIIGHKDDSDNDEEQVVEKSPERQNSKKRPVRHSLFSREGFLSAKAKNHIRFVTEINSTLMETAIFSYLGIFLFNKRYHWSFWIPTVAIFACLWSRAVTVWFFSFVSNIVTRVGFLGARKLNCGNQRNERQTHSIIDGRMQTVLIFAGLRGAMSFALVETIPLFDESTRQGSRFKPELKAMTSACIVFTVFIMGGYTDYLLEKVGMKPTANRDTDVEMVSLVGSASEKPDQWSGDESTSDLKQRSLATRSIVQDDSSVRRW